MDDHSRNFNSLALINGEILWVSLIGVILITTPIVRERVQRL